MAVSKCSCGCEQGEFDVELYPPVEDREGEPPRPGDRIVPLESFGRFRCGDVAIYEDGELVYCGPVHVLVDAARIECARRPVMVKPTLFDRLLRLGGKPR